MKAAQEMQAQAISFLAAIAFDRGCSIVFSSCRSNRDDRSAVALSILKVLHVDSGHLQARCIDNVRMLYDAGLTY